MGMALSIAWIKSEETYPFEKNISVSSSSPKNKIINSVYSLLQMFVTVAVKVSERVG